MSRKILIVDDDKSFVELYQERLIVAGYDVTYQPESNKAIETAIKIKPDLIILDIMMPVMSGEDVFYQLKANPATKNIPVFFMTALSGNSKLRESLTKQADGYLVKSEIIPKDLVNVLNDKFTGK